MPLPPHNAPGNARPDNRALVPAPGYVDVPAYPAYPGSASVSASQLQRYVGFLRKKWWVLLLSTLPFGALAAAYILWWPGNYVSIAHMWAAGKVGLQLHEGTTYAEDTQTFAGTQAELLQSERVLAGAFKRVQGLMPRVTIPTNSKGEPLLVTIKVSQIPKSALLELKAKGPTEEYTRAFLDATMDEFLAYKRELRQGSSQDTYTSVSEQIKRQESELKSAQDKLTAYMRDNNVAVLEEQAKAASAYLTQLLVEFSQLKLQHQLLEATSAEGPLAVAAGTNMLAGAPDPRQLTDRGAPSSGPPLEFLAAKQELEKIKIMRARLSRYLLPKHPKIVKLDEQIAQGAKLVEYFSQQSRDQLANAKQMVTLRLDRVQEVIKEWETKVNNASVRIAECQRLKLQVEGLQGLHDRLMGLLQTVDVTKNIDQENLTILDRASAAKLGKQSRALVIALALFAGIGAGLSLLFVMERMDDRVMSLDDLGGRFEEWIVGQVPEVKRAKKETRPALLESGDSRHIFAESHRSIRSALFFANYNEPKPKTLLVTSAIPNEGKSTVAANLARTIAFAGGRVLLVDGDLRRGVLHSLFEVPQGPGLSELLANGGDLSQFVIPIPLNPQVSGQRSEVKGQSSVVSGAAGSQVSGFTPHPSGSPPQVSAFIPHPSPAIPHPSKPGLYLLPRGKTPGNSGELFLSEKWDRLLARMREEYDCVIMDSIPVFAADDTTSLAPKMDGVLFVLRNKFTSADTARHALELLYERQAKILGLVFNRADTKSRSYRYYKYAEYYGGEKQKAESRK